MSILSHWDDFENDKYADHSLLYHAEDFEDDEYADHSLLYHKEDFEESNERPQGEWVDYSEEGFIECPFCHKATTCEDNIDELHYCWNCGAELRKGGTE